jgi:hypothetical protein
VCVVCVQSEHLHTHGLSAPNAHSPKLSRADIDELNLLLVQHIANMRQPLSRFQCPFLHKFHFKLNPAYTLPSYPTLRSKLGDLAAQLLDLLSRTLAKVKHTCIGLDFWSSSELVHYLGVLVFYIENWQLKLAALSFDEFSSNVFLFLAPCLCVCC